MTAADLIKASLRLIGVSRNPKQEELTDALQALNMLLGSWANKRTAAYALTKENFALVAGVGSYTIGTGSTWNTIRPTRIEEAYIRDADNIDYPVEIVRDLNQYARVLNKTEQARPTKLYYDPLYPSGMVYLSPVPETAETIYLHSMKSLTSFTTLTTDISLPPGYERALKFHLAVDLAPEFGVSVSVEVANGAEDSYRAIANTNTVVPVIRFDDIP